MELPREWAQMDADQLRALATKLMGELAERDVQISERDAALTARDTELARNLAELNRKQLKIDQLTHEMAILKRWQFAKRSEQLDAVQYSLLDESIDADIEAISLEIESLRQTPAQPPKDIPRRLALPAGFPRREIRHEPEHTQCSCGCALERIGEDVSEKLDYAPGVFSVERHIRGKWVCHRCETLIQAPVAPHIIDKGIPTGPHRQVSGSSASVPPGTDLWTGGTRASALKLGAVGRSLRSGTATFGRCAQGNPAQAFGVACG